MSAERDALDVALAARGEGIILRRVISAGASTINVDVACRARVDTVDAQQVIGTVTQSDLRIIMSPSEILAAQWPGGVPDMPVTTAADPRMPRPTDYVIARGKIRQVKLVDAKFAPDWCRINLTVAG